MVSIDTLLPSSNNTSLKQSATSENSSVQDGEGLFATMFSAHINETEEANALAIFSTNNIDTVEEIDGQSGKKLPNLSELDVFKLNEVNQVDKKNQKTTDVNIEKNEKKEKIPMFVDPTAENVESLNNSDDSFLSQIQASNKMSLKVSDEAPVNNAEIKSSKLTLEQAIDISKAPSKETGEKIEITPIKEAESLKGESYLSTGLDMKSNNLKDISSIILETDVTKSEKKSEAKELNPTNIEIEDSSQISKKIHDLPQIKLDNSAVNQLKQVFPELTVVQKSQLKQSLESALGELEKQKPSNEIEAEINKLRAILLQVDELISKEGVSPEKIIPKQSLNGEADNQVKEASLGFEPEVQAMAKGAPENNTVVTPMVTQKTGTIKSDVTHPAAKNIDKNYALGKDKNDNVNIQSTLKPENSDLMNEAESLDEIKLSAEVIKTATNSGMNADTLASTQATKTQVNSIFNDIIRQLEPQPNTGLESDPVTELTNSITTTQTTTSLNAKLENDKLLQQPINIARSDAAKLLNERVTFLLSQHNPQADIRLDPPELGSMIIRVRTDAEQAQINFSVQNQQAKELLEESMPKLREMLAEQGIDLGESNIEQQQQGQQEQASTNDNQNSGPSSGIESDAEIATVKVAGNKLGGVDFYA